MHTHFFPLGLPDLAAATGDARWPSLRQDSDVSGRIMCGETVFRPVNNQCWSLDSRVEFMDVRGVDVQVLSCVPIMLAGWADAEVATRWAHTFNEATAAAIQGSAHSQRFRWMAIAPLRHPKVDAVLRSAKAAGAVGIQIGAEVGGLELDDPTLDQLWRALCDLDLAAFVHPTDPSTVRRSGQPYEFAIGMHADTALAATALVFGGVLERFPSLRVGLAHGCGSFAWSLPRIQRGATLAGSAIAGDDVSHLVRRLWADTLVFDPLLLPLLIDRFGEDHLMLGSDHPFYPPSFGDPIDMLNDAVSCGGCTDHQRDQILGPNAQSFLG